MPIVFQSPGKIDLSAFTTFGVNAKENESAIGYFGTGLKYAVAVFLREGWEFLIYENGGHVPSISFEVGNLEFRNKLFSRPSMVTEKEVIPLPFTLELGKNWETWMAFRELWSNAKDENGEIYRTEDRNLILPEDQTSIVLRKKDEDRQLWNSRKEFFILDTEEPIFSTPSMEAYPGPSKSLFYKGFRVATTALPMQFKYNILDGLTLTEDRTASMSQAEDVLWQSLQEEYSGPEKHLEKILSSSLNQAEGRMMVLQFSRKTHLFKEVGNRLYESGRMENPWLKQMFQPTMEELISKNKTIPTPLQEKQLAKALALLQKNNWNITREEIDTISQFQGNSTMGAAMEGRIIICDKAFHMGTKALAGTILEEKIHLQIGYSDFSRELQNFLIDEIISSYEKISGDPL